MFTGLVEDIGIIEAVKHVGNAREITILAGKVMEGLKIGDSISVSGVCLTVTGMGNTSCTVQAVEETMARTSLSSKKIHDRVNLEQALRASDRLGGHIVQGHVDGIGRVTEISPEGEGTKFRFETERAIMRYIVTKGSVAVDGVSLTVVDTGPNNFSVVLIPHSIKSTTFSELKVGNSVNIETDVVAKYIEKLIRPYNEGMNKETLKWLGFE